MLWHNHYHNGYLDITVRGGLIGLVLFGVINSASLYEDKQRDLERALRIALALSE